jgi:hypothetical protein
MGMPVFFRMSTPNLNFFQRIFGVILKANFLKGKMHVEGAEKLQIALRFAFAKKFFGERKIQKKSGLKTGFISKALMAFALPKEARAANGGVNGNRSSDSGGMNMKHSGAGSVWTWVALDPDTKLVPCWFVSTRDAGAANHFMHDLAGRLAHRVQLTTDGHKPYLTAVESAFGSEIDYAMLVKIYGAERAGEASYSPAQCIRMRLPDSSTRLQDSLVSDVQFAI